MALVSCKAKPPKPAKAKALVEANFREKGYEVQCVNIGEYTKLGEKQWSTLVEVKQESGQPFPYEVTFKALRRGYELTCGFEYLLELDELVKRDVNDAVNKEQFKLLLTGNAPDRAEGAVNKNVKPFSVDVKVKYLLFEPSRVSEGDISTQPQSQAEGKANFTPEPAKLQLDLNNSTFLLWVLEACIKEQIVRQFEDELFTTVTVDALLSLNENGKEGYSGKAKISQKSRKRTGTLTFDMVLVENGNCKVTCRLNGFEDWIVDEGKDAKWRKHRLEILAEAWRIAHDPEKLLDKDFHPLGSELIEMANKAIEKGFKSTYWGDYTKLKPEENLTYMPSLNTHEVSFEGRTLTKTMLGNEYAQIHVNSFPPLATLFDSSSLEQEKFQTIDLEAWEKEIEAEIAQELEEKYDLRFMKDPDYLEKAYPVYQKLDNATVIVKEERGMKNVKHSGLVKAIGPQKIMIGPHILLIEDLTWESRLSFDMNYRKKKFTELNFRDAMMLKMITRLRTPMHDRRKCIRLQNAGYLPNVFLRNSGLYNPNEATWVTEYDFLAHWLRAHLIAKDLFEKEGYVYAPNMKMRLEWMPKKVAENFAVYIKVKYQRIRQLGEAMRKRREELEKLKMDGYSEEAIERAFWREFGNTDQGAWGRCPFCKGTGKELKYTGGGFYKTIECRSCFGTGKSSNVDDVTLDALGNVVKNVIEEFEDEEFWNTATVVPAPLK
ncbi:MAG: hypothetical protein IJT83_14905 [Victivallales bacterium]|nr:hypothetical protein [Victivallales bacterium]